MAQNIESLDYIVRPENQEEPVSVMHLYTNGKYQYNWKQSSGSHNESTSNRMVLLGALLMNFTVRWPSLQGDRPSLLRPSSNADVVFGGVDLKKVFGEDYFFAPSGPMEKEDLRRIGEEGMARIHQWLAAGAEKRPNAI